MILCPVVRDEATAPFFDGTARNVLLLRRSEQSGEIRPLTRSRTVTGTPISNGWKPQVSGESSRGRLCRERRSVLPENRVTCSLA